MTEQQESAAAEPAEDVSTETPQSSEAPNSEHSSEKSEERPIDWDIFDTPAEEDRAEPLPTSESASQEEEDSTESPSAEAEAEDDEDEELDAINETLTDDEKSQVNLPKPARRKLRALEKLEKAVLNPIRDTDTPIADAWKAISEFHPTRAQELAQAIAQESIRAYGDQWLPVILEREGITKEQIVNALDKKQDAPASPSPTTSDIPSLTDRPEVQELVKYLDETYDDWRDESKDEDLLDDDRLAVKSLRAQLAQEEALRSQLAKAKEEIDSLKPEVDSIKENQQTEYEKRLEAAANEARTEYRSKVDSRVLPKVFDDLGLNPTESDPDGIKAVKSLIKSKYEADGEYISDFEHFAQSRFSERDNLEKVVRRVTKNLDDAASKTLQAQTLKDKSQADKLLSEASRLKELAQDEQDTIAVLLNRAGKEFAKEYQPILDILAENAELKRKLSRGQRDPVSGVSTPGTSRAEIMKQIGESDNPFEAAKKAGLL